MSRQVWDEARHAMMGEVGFVALGVDWTQARITFNWSYRLNTECTPLERHAVLFFIEQGLMPKTGKRYEYEVAKESGIPIMATIQDFDWADEVLHSQIGRQWLVPEFGTLQKALDYGDAEWSKITSNWSTVRDKGLTTTRKLVAEDLFAGLPSRRRRAGPRGAGVQRNLRSETGRRAPAHTGGIVTVDRRASGCEPVHQFHRNATTSLLCSCQFRSA